MASPKMCIARCGNELASQARFKCASARTPFAAGHRTRDCGVGCAAKSTWNTTRLATIAGCCRARVSDAFLVVNDRSAALLAALSNCLLPRTLPTNRGTAVCRRAAGQSVCAFPRFHRTALTAVGRGGRGERLLPPRSNSNSHRARIRGNIGNSTAHTYLTAVTSVVAWSLWH